MSRVWIAPREHRLASLLEAELRERDHEVTLTGCEQPLPESMPESALLLYDYDPLIPLESWVIPWVNRTPELLQQTRRWESTATTLVWPCLAWTPSDTPLTEEQLTLSTISDSSPCSLVARSFRAFSSMSMKTPQTHVMLPPLIGDGLLQRSWWQMLVHTSAQAAPVCFSPTMNQACTLGFVPDVVGAIVSRVEHPSEVSSVIFGGESVEPQEAARIAAEIASVKHKPVVSSDWMLTLRGLVGQPVPTAAVRNALSHPWRFSSHTAVTRLGYSRTPIRIAIEKTLEALGIQPDTPSGTIL